MRTDLFAVAVAMRGREGCGDVCHVRVGEGGENVARGRIFVVFGILRGGLGVLWEVEL